MADNPKKKKADGKRVSQQSYEQAYQRGKVKKPGAKPGKKAAMRSKRSIAK